MTLEQGRAIISEMLAEIEQIQGELASRLGTKAIREPADSEALQIVKRIERKLKRERGSEAA